MNNDNNLRHHANTGQQTHSGAAHLTSAVPVATIIAVVIVAAASGYLLGLRQGSSLRYQEPPQSSHKPSVRITVPEMSPIVRIIEPDRNVQQPTVNTSQGLAPHWSSYKSDFGYKFSYPSDWYLESELNAPISSVSSPSAKYPDGYFIVEREAGGAPMCETRSQFLLKDNPGIIEKHIKIGGYPAFRFDNGDSYGSTFLLLTRKTTCYKLHFRSDNMRQRAILELILSTFTFVD